MTSVTASSTSAHPVLRLWRHAKRIGMKYEAYSAMVERELSAFQALAEKTGRSRRMRVVVAINKIARSGTSYWGWT